MIRLSKIAKRSKSTWHKISNLDKEIDVALNRSTIIANWSNSMETHNNWGDTINPTIIQSLSKKRVIHVKDIFNITNKNVYSAIGSILDNNTKKNLVVWGSGFKKKDSRLIRAPKSVVLVRGPLTRNKLIKAGIDCPEKYGDPGLLYSRMYKPNIKIKYKLGIIPHYIDKDDEFIKKIKNRDNNNEIKIIDIKSGINKVVDDALSCEFIASSSLHGLILADSYEIPNIWIKISDKVIGGEFKFIDYYQSLNIDTKFISISDNTTMNDIMNSVRINKVDLYDVILDACPFKV